MEGPQNKYHAKCKKKKKTKQKSPGRYSALLPDLLFFFLNIPVTFLLALGENIDTGQTSHHLEGTTAAGSSSVTCVSTSIKEIHAVNGGARYAAS